MAHFDFDESMTPTSTSPTSWPTWPTRTNRRRRMQSQRRSAQCAHARGRRLHYQSATSLTIGPSRQSRLTERGAGKPGGRTARRRWQPPPGANRRASCILSARRVSKMCISAMDTDFPPRTTPTRDPRHGEHQAEHGLRQGSGHGEAHVAVRTLPELGQRRRPQEHRGAQKSGAPMEHHRPGGELGPRVAHEVALVLGSGEGERQAAEALAHAAHAPCPTPTGQPRQPARGPRSASIPEPDGAARFARLVATPQPGRRGPVVPSPSSTHSLARWLARLPTHYLARPDTIRPELALPDLTGFIQSDPITSPPSAHTPPDFTSITSLLTSHRLHRRHNLAVPHLTPSQPHPLHFAYSLAYVETAQLSYTDSLTRSHTRSLTR